jgi:hypothetical protein
MNKKKLFAVVISLALVIAVVLPGTLAVSTDQTSSNGTIEVSTETTTPAPGTTETPAPEETEAPVETPTEEPAKTCTCDPAPAEGEAHKEGCPLYAAPEQPADETKTCTCDPAPAEGEAHKAGCPLYVAPEKPADPSHIDTCSDDCTDADCKCPCHLFDRLMACQTLEEIEAIIKATPEDVLRSLSEEQVAQVEAYMDKLMPAPLPAIVIEESEPPVESEIYRPTVNYTNVAPFGKPVTGGN